MTDDIVWPGWYPDPEDPTITRWWDGRTWTNRTRMARLETAQPPVPRMGDSSAGTSTTHPPFHWLLIPGLVAAWPFIAYYSWTVSRQRNVKVMFVLWAMPPLTVAWVIDTALNLGLLD